MSHFEGTVYHGGEGTVGGEQLQLGQWEHNTHFSSHLCGLGGRERERDGEGRGRGRGELPAGNQAFKPVSTM